MIVVDTNIIAYFFLPGKEAKLSGQLLQAEPDWAAPSLWRSEFRNVLALYIRKKIISYDLACRFMASAEDVMMDHTFEVNSDTVLRLVESSSCSSYDCEFVALAQSLGVPLVTSDKKLIKSFSNICQSLQEAVR